MLHMMRFLALICAHARLDYIVTANVPALHLTLHMRVATGTLALGHVRSNFWATGYSPQPGPLRRIFCFGLCNQAIFNIK